jgi:methyl-accepting chemotaxis protein
MKFVNKLSLPPVNFVEEIQNDKANWVRLFALVSVGLLTGTVSVVTLSSLVRIPSIMLLPIYALFYSIIFGGLAYSWKSPARRQRYVFAIIGCHSLMVGYLVINHIVKNATLTTILTAASYQIFGFGLALFTYFFAGRRYILTCYLLQSIWWIFFFVVQLTYSTQMPTFVILLVPLAMGIVLLQGWHIVISGLFNVGFMCYGYLAQDIFQLYSALQNSSSRTIAANGSIVFITICIPVMIFILVVPQRRQLKLMQTQNDRLKQAYAELESRQEIGQRVSHEMLNYSAELSATAGQQVVSNQEQLAFVTQLNTAIAELSAAAANIADFAQRVNLSMSQVADDSANIEQVTTEATDQSEKGLAALQEIIKASRQVATLYQELVNTLQDLNGKNAKMRRIIDLLGTIAGETHLLALNAAIEAAGAGQYGERFAVVAQEVKSLASRSATAGREVVGIIEEIGAATAQALDATQSGFERAQQMQQVTGLSEAVIGQMLDIALKSRQQAGSIKLSTREARELTETISTATAQQRVTSKQVADALGRLYEIADQNVTGSRWIADTATRLEKASSELNDSLVVSKS